MSAMTKLERGEEQDVQLILHMLKYFRADPIHLFSLSRKQNTWSFTYWRWYARVDHPINHDIVVYYATVQVHVWILNFN